MFREGDHLGPYTLVSKIGSGAFGTVWLADRQTPIATTRVALKLPSGDDVNVDAIRHEANTWVQASGHPNVVPIIEANIYDEQVVIASEYIAEGSLEDWLNQNGGKAPSIEAAVDMTRGILAGLEHLHSRHIIHRDLKPANLLIQGETPRLADFGISRVLNTSSRTALAAGTPSYMAPEAFDGKRTEQTDLWAVGVMLYQMLVGRLPFPQQEMTSLIGAIVARNPDPLPAFVPAPLQGVINCALAKNSAQRYRSANEMRSALRNAMKQMEQGRTHVEPRPSTPPPTVPIMPQPQPPYQNPGAGARPFSTSPANPMPTAPRSVAPTMPVAPSYPPQSYPPGMYQPVKPKRTSPMVFVIIAVAVVVIGLGAIAWVKWFGMKESSGSSNTSNNPVASVNKNSVAPTNNNTAPPRNANLAPITPIPVEGNVYKIEEAGLQFEKPAGWEQEVEGDQVSLTAPDGRVNVRFMVSEQENLQTAVNALGIGLRTAMNNVQTTSQMSQTTHNGMTVYTQSGTGVKDGINLVWEADIVMADKPVIVLIIADRASVGTHSAEIKQLVDSVKPIE